ncbi:mRNA export factor [Bombyx mandarina]|uniref:mRNA export protein n=2 Tax=Bombyx TaxID=7090 RepID=Q2F5M2_BOMMO|nr:mRNA export protein [Bombyx mori]XP_028038804.1 mRNA export factor [Bombyx mandarina]ABD36345.1 mRNA export protein [Bombyx mori]
MFGSQISTGSNNPNKDVEVSSPPDDTVSALEFSPPSVTLHTFLIAGSWDCQVRCWEVETSGKTVPKAAQPMDGPVLDVAWHDDGTKVFMASTDKSVKCWDLAANQTMQVAAHDAPVKTCHWIKAPNYTCLMTTSWDKTLKFWDTRTAVPSMTLNLTERAYCADVEYPMAVVGTADRGICMYTLEGKPAEFKRIESPLKHQHRCVSIFKDKKSKQPTGFALGSVEGRVAIQYVNPTNPKDNFTFKCHRTTGAVGGYQDIYAVNDIAFHPVHGTLATVGSDGSFSFWDKDARTKLKSTELLDQSLTKCAFNHSGQIFAYAVGYDWSKGHEHYNPNKKTFIYLRASYEELKARPTQ